MTDGAETLRPSAQPPGFRRVHVARAMLHGTCMSTARMALRLLPGEGGTPSRHRERDAGDWLIFVVAALAAGSQIVSAWRGSSEGSAIRAMPAERSEALLSETVRELRAYCGEGRAEGLRDHCRQLASFAAQFDECRGECEAAVQHELTHAPTR